MSLRWLRIPGVLVCALTLASCGGNGQDTTEGQSTATKPESTTVEQVATTFESEDGSGLDVCGLLSSDQVSTVLPGHDGGTVALSGDSLMEGIDAYQCSYTAIADNDIQLLTVILNVASTDELFEEIKPTGFAYEDDEAISVADGGWSSGETDDWKITVLKDRTIIDLELMAPTAQEQSAQLLELAKAILEKV